MVVPMKKVSLIVLEKDKKTVLKKLRKLGLLHIEISEGKGGKLPELNEEIHLLENAIFTLSEKAKKPPAQKSADTKTALSISQKIKALTEEKADCHSQIASLVAENERLKNWGELDTRQIFELKQKGVDISLYEIPLSEYEKLDESITTICLNKTKNAVHTAIVKTNSDINLSNLDIYKVKLPEISTSATRQKITEFENRIKAIDDEMLGLCSYIEGMKNAVLDLQKQVEFETYSTGMDNEILSASKEKTVGVSYFDGYIEADNVEILKKAARENAWGLTIKEPTPDDDVPTKLRNNKFVSLIYPLTDFLGTVPGYFEYDISGWFLGFILIFFGIIFGDGGYGLLICAVAAVLIAKSYKKDKAVPPTFLLIGLLGLATVIWGTLTCTWFGMSPEQLPAWLKSISLPIISNVNESKIWYPFWTNGEAGLTTAQNVQILCFSLALVQLTVAHIKCAVRSKSSLKILGDIGSVMQLFGMFYIVLSLVVNGKVFGFDLVISGVPIGTMAILLIAVGFILSFVFSNYEGSIGKSVVESLKNIVSVLLGVVNVFSDIVSYIRLWAVGLAGAAISATVNELASPMLGNFMMIIFAIIILVFGHGLDMILNVLSVIVHGVRLNTLEFSTHLDMSWSGHKFKPFTE